VRVGAWWARRNSINDLAASLTIARDGYASMAVAGAYAGPMFNVLAGEVPCDAMRCGGEMEGLAFTPRTQPSPPPSRLCPALVPGIGLPMLIATAKPGAPPYNVGAATPIVIMAYVALLTPLTVTLIWVPFEGWRITHRIGRFLCVWFFGFILATVIAAATTSSEGSVEVAG
jgi:Ca2+/Na+ antiporter